MAKKSKALIWEFDLYGWQNYPLKDLDFKKHTRCLTDYKNGATQPASACVLGRSGINEDSFIQYGYIIDDQEFVFCWQTYWDETHRALSKGKRQFYDSLQQGVNFEISYNFKEPSQHFISEPSLVQMNDQVIFLDPSLKSGKSFERPKLRIKLMQELEKIKGISCQNSKISKGQAYFFNNKEIAHFHHHTEIDVRLTKKIIKSEKLTHPKKSEFHKNRAMTSDWLEIQIQTEKDVKEILRLIQLLLKQS